MDDTTVTEATQAADEQPQDTPAADTAEAAEAGEAGQETTGEDTSTGQGEDSLSLGTGLAPAGPAKRSFRPHGAMRMCGRRWRRPWRTRTGQ